MKLISSRSKYSPKRTTNRNKGFFRRLSAKERIIFIAPAIAAIIAIAVAFFINETAERYTLPYAGIRYYAGGRFELEDGSVLRRTSEDTTVVEQGNNDYTLDTLPIYYEGQNTVMFANDMVYVEPRMNEVFKLDYFTEVNITDKDEVFAIRDGEQVYLRNGFAYDGEDIYIFFEDVVLEYNGYKMTLPALSYIEAVFTGEVMIYNSGAGEQYMEAPKTDVIVTMGGTEYKLSLLVDAMEHSDGSKQLIFTRPEALESVF
ncbi:MAG: hypothetical protein R3Y09_08560 [Clostridia bacterium]